jgi:poly-gamma-glutamate capsule biosynthesis protein CapA/YwtB (metallophosphatase superfamily)
MSSLRQFRVNLIGDIMLGRLIDQLSPIHNNDAPEAEAISSVVQRYSHLQNYNSKSPWGNTLVQFHAASLNIINLETAVTTHSRRWPNKTFNYRMHPENIEALVAASVDFANLANNHSLDFCEEGLLETVQTLTKAGILVSGAGESEEQARAPALLSLPRSLGGNGRQTVHKIHVFGGSDHPGDWSTIPTFHHISYDNATRKRLKQLLSEADKELGPPSLKIFSVHWGPNYSWSPSANIQSLAHFLIDECGVDIVHGHSSHHIQGVEKYKGKLVLYGCGDFVDDYAVNSTFRNDLGAIWQVTVAEQDRGSQNALALKRLDIFPTRIKRFQVNLLDRDDADHKWVREKLAMLCNEFDTEIKQESSETGQLVVDL